MFASILASNVQVSVEINRILRVTRSHPYIRESGVNSFRNVAPHQGAIEGHVCDERETRTCSKKMIHTGTSVLPQRCALFQGVDLRGFMRLRVLTYP